MEKPVSIVLVGIGGMGAAYLAALLENKEQRDFRLVGTVDPQPRRCPQLAELRALDIPVFERLEEFYARHRADLAIIASPIHFHCGQSCLALSRESSVLCEKPAAGTVQEVLRMREAERAAGRWVAVGFQWSFSTAIQALKNDLRAGMYGRPRRLKCLYLWPRNEAYYRRNDWAGKLKDPEGRWILDSPANNAMAHDLHNMFYVLGRETTSSAGPAEVEAELYRANAIENFDTAAARVRTEEGVEILFFVSHASNEDRGPVVRYEFEKAVVRCDSRTSGLWAEFPDGTRKDYGVPDAEPMNKLWQSIAGAREEGARPLCGLDAAASQTLCMNGIQDSMPDIRTFPAGLIRTVESAGGRQLAVGTPGARRVVVEGLDEALAGCYDAGKLPSELGLSWSAKGTLIDLREYEAFPSR
jgi:predicted dehydrogenase